MSVCIYRVALLFKNWLVMKKSFLTVVPDTEEGRLLGWFTHISVPAGVRSQLENQVETVESQPSLGQN